MRNCASVNLEISDVPLHILDRSGASHRAALRGDPLALSGMAVFNVTVASVRVKPGSGTGAIVLILAFQQRRAAMPANRERRCLAAKAGLAARIAALLISREIDDVGSRYYDFLNHCCPRGVRQRYCRQVSLKSSAQHSNFTREIAAAKAGFLSNIAGRKAYSIRVHVS
jgi:hypothetical protein